MKQVTRIQKEIVTTTVELDEEGLIDLIREHYNIPRGAQCDFDADFFNSITFTWTEEKELDE